MIIQSFCLEMDYGDSYIILLIYLMVIYFVFKIINFILLYVYKISRYFFVEICSLLGWVGGVFFQLYQFLWIEGLFLIYGYKIRQCGKYVVFSFYVEIVFFVLFCQRWFWLEVFRLLEFLFYFSVWMEKLRLFLFRKQVMLDWVENFQEEMIYEFFVLKFY